MCHTKAAVSALKEDYSECYYSYVAIAAATNVEDWAQDWFIMWKCHFELYRLHIADRCWWDLPWSFSADYEYASDEYDSYLCIDEEVFENYDCSADPCDPTCYFEEWYEWETGDFDSETVYSWDNMDNIEHFPESKYEWRCCSNGDVNIEHCLVCGDSLRTYSLFDNTTETCCEDADTGASVIVTGNCECGNYEFGPGTAY